MKITFTVTGPAAEVLSDSAKAKDISKDAAAERLILMGAHRAQAQAKYQKAQRKTAKPKKTKAAKPKAAKAAKPRAAKAAKAKPKATKPRAAKPKAAKAAKAKVAKPNNGASAEQMSLLGGEA